MRFLSVSIGFLFLFNLGVQFAIAQPQRFPVEGSNGEWYVDSAERRGDVRFAEFAGRRCMWLRNNTQVVRSDVEFTDGTIEFDVAPMEKGNFVAVIFRRGSATNHENIYLRIHRSGLYNATQYAPRINGSSTWQLYPEFNSKIDLPRLQWTRVRVEVRGTSLEAFINDELKPVLSIARLRALPKTGSVGFWGRVNEKPMEWAAGISNVSIRPIGGSSVTAEPGAGAGRSEWLGGWEVAEVAAVASDVAVDPPEGMSWKRMEAEENGLVNLNRIFPATRGRRTAYARTSIASPEAVIARLQIGYSDDIAIFLNGESVYRGVNGFESRHPEYMGFVKPDFENVYLKLRKGGNDLVLAVTDNQLFGWGFAARLRR
jgi:hypothetical protein